MSYLTRAMPYSRALAHKAILKSCIGRSSLTAAAPISSSAMTMSKRESSSGNFTPLWTVERGISASLIGIVPLALTMPNLATEFVLALSLTAHIHWGLEAIVVDYVRPRIVGKLLPKVAIGAIYVLSFATLGGLMYFNFTDVGLAHAVRILWKL